MRAGGYTVHQSLTAEAAAVLKLAMGLAHGRGHAQVTPLHVAFTLLGSSSFPAAAASSAPPCVYYGLLRRACGAVPSQCRALELCFNVALDRLPTTTHAALGSSSSSLSTPFAASLVHQPNPTLSNALVAALKRAQANQRRGCAELQSQLPPPPTQPTAQQQPLITIKVELDQLIVSILDDPSVSRVMREAGFSSAAVKTRLEEESAMLLGSSTSSSSLPAPAMALPSQFFLDPFPGLPNTNTGDNALWPAQFVMDHPKNNAGFDFPCKEEDVRAILDVMSRKQGRRSNPVVVGDSVSAAEASVAELMRRLERGAVADELRGAHVLRLHLSHVHVRLMGRADVDAWVADLRRTVAACTSTNTKAAALVIYVGDTRWAVDDDVDNALRAACCYSPAKHMAAALARLLGELRAAGRAWLVAVASYKTYTRCQRRALEAMWALQPVFVPAGAGLSLGLALGPRAASGPKDGKIGKPARCPLLDWEPKQEDGVATLCIECAMNFESEASSTRAEAEGTNLALSCFPGWPQAGEPHTSHTDDLMELKRKWSRLCRRVHSLYNQQLARPSKTKSGDPGLCLSFEMPTRHGTANKVNLRDVNTTLSLLLLPTDSVETSNGEVHRYGSEDLDDRLTIRVELPFGELKRKADESTDRPPSKSKRRRGGSGIDLNLRAEEEGDGVVSGSEGRPVPSDLTNDDGQGGTRSSSSGDVTDSHS